LGTRAGSLNSEQYRALECRFNPPNEVGEKDSHASFAEKMALV